MRFVGLLVVEDVAASAGPRQIGRPYALELVANQPIAHHVIDVMSAAGIRELVVVSSSAHAEAVRECLAPKGSDAGLALRYVRGSGRLDLAGGLRLAAPVVGPAPCVLHAANGLSGEPLRPSLSRVAAGGADIVLFTGPAPLAGQGRDPLLSAIPPPAQTQPAPLGAGVPGIWVFGPGALSRAATLCRPSSDDGIPAEISEAGLEALGRVQVRAAPGWCEYAGDPAELLDLNRAALDRLDPDPRSPHGSGNRIEGRVSIADRVSMRSSVILGPVVIGPGARIIDAYIGPYTSIGAGAHIEGAEIEQSIIAERASVMHVGGRIVASIVGREARVFRDFSLPKALRLRLGDGTEVALC
jgi:glucose-1-phosphate thymidylyltransferase